MTTTTSNDPPPQGLEYTTTIHTAMENHQRKKLRTGIILTSLFSFYLLLIILHQTRDPLQAESPSTNTFKLATKLSIIENQSPTVSRGVTEGVSMKGLWSSNARGLKFAWTNGMLLWQRTGYHFQPEKNWMNDPNGPLFYKGWYHLFYQYNPYAAVWGNITWGHAVSRDLINWLHLPIAMVGDQSYDINGVWTGSATILPDGRIVMLYTGATKDDIQVQCVAYPANSSDPLIHEWIKDVHNPVIVPPAGISHDNFRDPSTAWLSPDGLKWRITVGSEINNTGLSFVYETNNFVKYTLLNGFLHEVPGTGMWECIDFYPVSLTDANGLDTSANGPGVKHVMKVGAHDSDYYALGTYDPINNKWALDDSKSDLGTGLRNDYGKYYASKTFYDKSKKRRILVAWVQESSGEDVNVRRGWAGIQAIPRTIVYDHKTGGNILQWPVEEVESLRSKCYEFNNVKLEPGAVVPLKIDSTSQFDIMASFEIDKGLSNSTAKADSDYNCTTSGGSANRGALGPFGILVLADEAVSELTPIYFYLSKEANGKTAFHFCADELRSSEGSDVEKAVYGSKVPVLDGEILSIRSLVDHSVVESFAQGGRTVITSRVYPTKAINRAARVFLFNNATGVSVTASVKAWDMNSADIHRFPVDHLQTRTT